MKKHLKWIIPCAMFTVAVAVTATILLLHTAGGGANAASATRTVKAMSARSTEVIKCVETLDAEDFAFPQWCENRATFGDYVKSLGRLYNLCAVIDLKNAEIEQKRAEIVDLMAKSKELGDRVYKERKNLDAGREEYRDIEHLCLRMRENIEGVSYERKSVTKSLRDHKKGANGFDVADATYKYETIMQRLDARIVKLDAIKSDVEKLCHKLCMALGEDCDCPECERAATVSARFMNAPVKQPRVKRLDCHVA